MPGCVSSGLPRLQKHPEILAFCHLYSKTSSRGWVEQGNILNSCLITDSGVTKVTLVSHPESLLSSVPSKCQVIPEVDNEEDTEVGHKHG